MFHFYIYRLQFLRFNCYVVTLMKAVQMEHFKKEIPKDDFKSTLTLPYTIIKCSLLPELQ